MILKWKNYSTPVEPIILSVISEYILVQITLREKHRFAETDRYVRIQITIGASTVVVFLPLQTCEVAKMRVFLLMWSTYLPKF